EAAGNVGGGVLGLGERQFVWHVHGVIGAVFTRFQHRNGIDELEGGARLGNFSGRLVEVGRGARFFEGRHVFRGLSGRVYRQQVGVIVRARSHSQDASGI